MNKLLSKTALAFSFFILCHSLWAQLPDSPNGELLYFEQIRLGKGELMAVDISTGKKRQIGQSGSRPDHFPSWSSKGDKILFESYREGGWHVWISNSDGSDARRLSNLPSYNTRYYEFDPAISPDNQTAIFVQGMDLMTVKLDNLTPKRLTPQENGISETAPTYSPDGQSIAMMGYAGKDKSWDIYTLSADGKRFTRLTMNQGRNLAPQWSPDGESILFYSDRSGSFEIYEMKKDGTNVHPIFSQAQLNKAGFVRTKFIDPWDNNYGATSQYRASYSPDGRWITFSREIGGDRELFVARRDGTNIRRITFRKGLDASPMWRPNK